MGQGVQPQPVKARRAHTANLTRGRRKPFTALNGEKPAHGLVAQWGRSPVPSR